MNENDQDPAQSDPLPLHKYLVWEYQTHYFDPVLNGYKPTITPSSEKIISMFAQTDAGKFILPMCRETLLAAIEKKMNDSPPQILYQVYARMNQEEYEMFEQWQMIQKLSGLEDK